MAENDAKSKKYVLNAQQLSEIESLKPLCPKSIDDLRADGTDRLILTRMGNAVKGDFNSMQSLLGLDYSSSTYAGVMKAKNIRNEYFDGDLYDAVLVAIDNNSYESVMNALQEMKDGQLPTVSKQTDSDTKAADTSYTLSLADMKLVNPKRRTFTISEDAATFMASLDTSRIGISEFVNYCILFVRSLIEQGKIEVRYSIGDLFSKKPKE